VIDPDDDVATTRRVRARFPVVVAAPPRLNNPRELARMMLKALGKRPERWPAETEETWRVLSVWLEAHRITSVAVLCAQHLSSELCATAQTRLNASGVSLALVFGRRSHLSATTTLDDLLAAPLTSPPPPRSVEPWPRVPDSHPLRFRYDCDLQLDPEDALRVRLLFHRVWQTLTASLDRADINDFGLSERIAVLGYAADANEYVVRQNAIDVALITEGKPRPQPPTLKTSPALRPLRDLALRETDARQATVFLAEFLTGLRSDALELLDTEQLLDGNILGIRIPDCALPIVRALQPGETLEIPEHTRRWHREHFEALLADFLNPRHPPPQATFALKSLLVPQSPRGRVLATELDTATQRLFDRLTEQQILHFDGEGYRVTDIARYSAFQRPWARAPGLAEHEQPANPA
jgi:hypothetical protein